MVGSALAKGAVLGTTLGLAALGAMDLAFAAIAHDWINGIKADLYFDEFALGGGLLGIVGQIARQIFFG